MHQATITAKATVLDEDFFFALGANRSRLRTARKGRTRKRADDSRAAALAFHLELFVVPDFEERGKLETDADEGADEVKMPYSGQVAHIKPATLDCVLYIDIRVPRGRDNFFPVAQNQVQVIVKQCALAFKTSFLEGVQFLLLPVFLVHLVALELEPGRLPLAKIGKGFTPVFRLDRKVRERIRVVDMYCHHKRPPVKGIEFAQQSRLACCIILSLVYA